MEILPGPLPDGRRSGGDEGLGWRLPSIFVTIATLKFTQVFEEYISAFSCQSYPRTHTSLVIPGIVNEVSCDSLGQAFRLGAISKVRTSRTNEKLSYGTLPPSRDPLVLKRKCDRQWEKFITNGFKCRVRCTSKGVFHDSRFFFSFSACPKAGGLCRSTRCRIGVSAYQRLHISLNLPFESTMDICD